MAKHRNTTGGKCRFWGKGKKIPKGWRMRRNLKHGLRLICKVRRK